MSTSSSDVTAGPLLCNGATVEFPFSFRLASYGDVSAADQIKVILVTTATGAETVLTEGVNAGQFAVALNGDQDSAPGGTVETVTTYPSGYKIFIRRKPSYSQQTELTNQGPYNASVVETQFDQIQFQLNDLNDRVRRSPVAGLQIGESFNGEITGAPIAGAIPQLNSGLTGFEWVANDGSSSSVTATGSLTARSLANRFAASKDVRDFGAVWDGSSHPLSGYYATLAAAQAVYPHATALTNEIDWAATQAAVNALGAQGSEVVLPNGVGVFDQTLVLGDGTSSSKSTRVGIRLRSIAGVSGSADLSEYTTPGEGCRIKWNGADSTSAAMLDVRGPIHSIRVEGIVFDCAGLAGIGIKIRNLFNSYFENVRAVEYTTLGWDFQSYDAALPSGVTLYSGHNVFINCGAFNPWDSGAVATGASALRMYGGPVNNAGMSRNNFYGGDWHYGGAANTYGLALYYADNNLFQGMLFTAVGGGTSGDSVRLIKNETGDNQGLFPLENTFVQCPGIDNVAVYDDSGNAITSDEIGSNLFLGYSTSDGAEVPTHNKITALLHTGEITNLIVRDDRLIIKDNSDGTKRAQFQCSGISAGQTRNITLPDADITLPNAFASSTWTPTLTGIANCETLTAYAGQYTRIGNTVTFSVVLALNPTAATTITQFAISVPVASNFSSPIHAAGVGACQSVTNTYPASLYADATNDRLEVSVYPVSDTDQLWSFSGTYRVI